MGTPLADWAEPVSCTHSIEATMAHSYRELRELTTDELVREYDRVAGSTLLGLSFIREELARREFEEQNQRMLKMTHQMRVMTLVITVLTVLNVALVAWVLLGK